MADSSFDPLGMVKAMGPQRDPYSWAELYAQDASKGRLQQEEMKNRLLIQEMVRAERAKEGALDRANRASIASGHDAAAMARLKKSVELGLRGAGSSRIGPMTADKPMLSEKEWRRVSRTPAAKDYRTLTLPSGKNVYYHKDAPPKPMFAAPVAPAATAAPANPAARAPAVIPDEDDDY